MYLRTTAEDEPTTEEAYTYEIMDKQPRESDQHRSFPTTTVAIASVVGVTLLAVAGVGLYVVCRDSTGTHVLSGSPLHGGRQGGCKEGEEDGITLIGPSPSRAAETPAAAPLQAQTSSETVGL